MIINYRLFIVILLIIPFKRIHALKFSDFVIVILSQKEDYNAAQAQILRSDLFHQAKEEEKEPPLVILAHQLDIKGDWTISPIIEYLYSKNITALWYIFCMEFTKIRLSILRNILDQYDPSIRKNLWIGHALHDVEPTIIHHYNQNLQFKYPNLASGFAIGKLFLEKIGNENNGYVTDFSIDTSYEFSKLLLDKFGTPLTHCRQFCVVANDECATFPRPSFSCGEPVSIAKVYVAVKTYSKNHQSRITVIRKTWGRIPVYIDYFTDKKDEYMKDGIIVPNTNTGHCAKTYAILEYVRPILEEKKIDWLLIADDDTLLSLSRLLKLLSCYNPKRPIALGQKYGFRTTLKNGYDYLTGGAGVVISTELVYKILETKACTCPSPNTPDDMFLFGICLAHLSIKITHSPAFHQARPDDYSQANFASYDPISFHKFWMINPYDVYNQWFAESDEFISSTQSDKRDEL